MRRDVITVSPASGNPSVGPSERPGGMPLTGVPYAIAPDHLRALGASVREATRALKPQALTAWADAPIPQTYAATVRDGIATVPVRGPLQMHWSFWCWLFGGTSCEVLAKDLVTLRDDDSVRAIVLSFDSPGGQVAGIHELARTIRAVAAVKPVVAHVAGMALSAGYWLAAAATEVIADPTALLGNIGAILGFYDTRGLERQLGVRRLTLVSSQSPRKPMDPTTAQGRADWQVVLDDLAAVFLSDVAEFRGADADAVRTQFGEGAVLVGEAAVAAGLADALGTADDVRAALLAELAGGTPSLSPSPQVSR